MTMKYKDIKLRFNNLNEKELEILKEKKARSHAYLIIEYLKNSRYTNKQKEYIIRKIIESSKDLT